MKKSLIFAFAAISFCMTGLQLAALPLVAQDRGWDTVPHEFREAQRRGFQDGLEGARKDQGNHRVPDPNNRDEFRHPPVPREAAEDYRTGFRRGYEVGVKHYYQDAPGQGGGPRGGGAPGGMNLDRYRHNGFEDGQAGAQKDFGNHRVADPNNRDEFRHPSVPEYAVEAYRDGFRHGYEDAARQLWRSDPMPPPPSRRWDDAPMEFTQVRRDGFQAGLAAAQRDYERQLRPSVERQEFYQHPVAPPPMWEEFRVGFRRGYEVANQHLYPTGLPALFPGEVPPSPWQTMEHNSFEGQRKGFVAGLLAADQDYEAGYAGDPGRHPEYAKPEGNFMVRAIYKTGYKMGYDTALGNLQRNLPEVATPVARHGFFDGVAGALRDFEQKLMPDLRQHPEYTQPQMGPAQAGIYQSSFQRGYAEANSYLQHQ